MIGDELPALDWLQFTKSQGVIWQSCPVGAQFHNGACEATVKKAKKTLQHIYSNTRLTALEVEIALKRIVAILNSQPLARHLRHDKGMGQDATSLHPEFMEPLTANHLLIR